MGLFRWVALGVMLGGSGWAAEDARLADEFTKDIRPALVKLCGDCHHKDKDVPFLKVVELRDMNAQRGVWRSVVGQLQNRTMPPADEKLQPTEAERIRLAGWLEKTMRLTASGMNDYAGAPIARRLNRLEYDNTIRDLVGLEMNFSETFPTEGAGGEGFSNNGETLFLPAILMERYLEAAQQILDNAIITPPLRQAYNPGDLRIERGATFKTAKLEDKPGQIWKEDEASVAVGIFLTGDYELSLTARSVEKDQTAVALKIDGIAVNTFKVAKGADAEKPVAAVLRLQRGVHLISVCGTDAPVALNKLALAEKQASIKESKRSAHKRIFGSDDFKAIAALPADARRIEAQRVIGAFATRAFRRPVNGPELEKFLTLYERSATRGDAFEESIKLALKAVLISPHLLFRAETEREKPGIYPLDDYELATRLSYFLWASMPDEELMRLAAEKKLNNPETLLAQVDRMLDAKLRVDGAALKSKSFVEDFTGQWLGTKEVGASVAFTSEKFKGIYTSDLADDLRAEPVQFMQHLISNNRSLLELIDADYVFATEITAKHYGIPAVSGSNFRLVKVSDGRRGGALGFGAVHMITSYPDRTSPVLRGAWVLETMLGIKVPNPPPDVPPLDKARKKQKDATLRAALELHRANPTCAACHNIIDPIGFGMENFDLLGRWRDKDGAQPVNASGVMPSGEKFNGPGELKKILLARKSDFARLISTKMLGYALGRSLDDQDDVTIEKLVSALERDGFHARTLIKEIVLSTPFRNRQGGEVPKKNATPKKKKELPAAKEK